MIIKPGGNERRRLIDQLDCFDTIGVGPKRAKEIGEREERGEEERKEDEGKGSSKVELLEGTEEGHVGGDEEEIEVDEEAEGNNEEGEGEDDDE
jgi:hypothetical protein